MRPTLRPIPLLSLLPSLLLGLLLPMAARAATYRVGPGQPLAAIGDVPWESLAPGDLVLIHHRAQPYREKWVLARQGTAQAPIVVRGVPGPAGELPVVDASGATTRAALDYWGEERGLLKIGGSNRPPDTRPAWIVVENLELVGARQPRTFTGRNGQGSYAMNAASVYIEKGDHVTLRNLVLRDSGNGLFIASSTTDVLVEGCHIAGNGNVGSVYEHNAYTSAAGITYQYNHFGPPCAGCSGNNLKDRSAATVVRLSLIHI